MLKRKIAIVVQRYGKEINGGAEVHARMIAEKLHDKYDITVLTSRAIDYHTWKPLLKEGVQYENDIKIIRFDHPCRDKKNLRKITNKIKGRTLWQLLNRLLNNPRWLHYLKPNVIVAQKDYEDWAFYQGPATEDLIRHIKEYKNEYDVFIFFTYLYFPTIFGLKEVGDKSILIPTMHDEKPAYYDIFKKIMQYPKWIFFNTEAEKKFSEKLFDIKSNKKEVVAVGIDLNIVIENKQVLNKFKIKKPYIIYVGRIDAAKGCQDLIKYFKNFISINDADLELVLVGKNMMKEEKHPDIIYTGFISDEEKNHLIANAKLLVVPSYYESLSLVLLEAFSLKIPVLANGLCDVLYDHINNSKAGLTYTNQNEFNNALGLLIGEREMGKNMGENGYNYVLNNYTWKRVISKFDLAIQDISENNNS
jgi:glycosyltransferase involved in cell wall biosynthesis